MTEARPLRHDALPPPTRRGLHREEAAAYVGISPTTFDRMVSDTLMPKPLRVYGRNVWDRVALDKAFDQLQGSGDFMQSPEEGSPWDEVLK